MDNNQDMSKMCKCNHHKMFSWLVVLFGLTFLLGDLNVLTAGAVSVIWPVLIIIAGVGKMCKCCHKHHE